MSEKTIADKMYLKNVKSIAIFNAGAHPAAAAQMPPELLVTNDEPADVVLMFALNRAELEQWFAPALAQLGDKGALWIAYMKQSAPKATDINRDTINAYAREHGASAVAIISLDADWSALRLKRL